MGRPNERGKQPEGWIRVEDRQLLAYAEERALLYREMVRLHEQLLSDLIQEAVTPAGGILKQVERSMKDMGIIAPQNDV